MKRLWTTQLPGRCTGGTSARPTVPIITIITAAQPQTAKISVVQERLRRTASPRAHLRRAWTSGHRRLGLRQTGPWAVRLAAWRAAPGVRTWAPSAGGRTSGSRRENLYQRPVDPQTAHLVGGLLQGLPSAGLPWAGLP